MDNSRTCLFSAELAEHIRQARHELTGVWLDRIAARASVAQHRALPRNDLTVHVPLLLGVIADYLEDSRDDHTSSLPVIAKATELASLRFTPGLDASEILKEYEILGDVLCTFATRVVPGSVRQCAPADAMMCAHRIFRAVSIIEQVTTAQYLRVLADHSGQREARLRRFNRMITHELKNRVGATLGAGQLLLEEWLDEDERRRFASMVTENAQSIQNLLENLIALSWMDGGRRRQRSLPLDQVVAEVVRQLREPARTRNVEVRVQEDLPAIDVNAAAVELCLSNYLSNAIKYSDSVAARRWVRITAAVTESHRPAGGAELVVRVHDNGVGVPDAARGQLFERFFRAHANTTGAEGTGLGLNLVLETTEALGGRAWAEFNEGPGSVFAFALPCRRAGEPGHLRRRFSGAVGAAGPDGFRRPGAAPVTASD